MVSVKRKILPVLDTIAVTVKYISSSGKGRVSRETLTYVFISKETLVDVGNYGTATNKELGGILRVRRMASDTVETTSS